MKSAMLMLGAAILLQQGESLRVALKDIECGQGWIYNDLDAGFAEAKKSGKPLLVVFR